ncbi:acyloxyacyl hydrolase [Glacieibacterium sp.]|uniref:acyloxyacyl hydrolase n=1 Tax=Glacieibacterium sp. TaxID=2860237 RepID=UPI003B00924B
MLKPAVLLALTLATPAAAGEIFAGVAAHGLDFGLVSGRYEGGTDLVAGARSAPVARFLGADVRLHVLGSVNLNHGVDFAAAGASLRFPFGGRFYIQPGLGVAIHDGSGAKYQVRDDRLYLGSRVLFEPELALGVQLSRRFAAEVAYVHLSHAQVFGGQNPGLDTLGGRLVYRFGR